MISVMKRKILLPAATGLGLVVALVLLGGVWLRQDKTHVFDQVRGRYQQVRVVESWSSEQSSTRLLEAVNHRGEGVATAYVRRPHQLEAGYKVVFLYAGVGTGRKILELVPERSDVVLVGPQYPYRLPQGLWGYLRMPADVRRAAFRSVAGGMLVTSFLEQDEGLDLSRLTVMGSSIGSAFATIHGALDPRVKKVIVIHGGGDFPAVIRFLERRRGRRWAGELEALLADYFVDTFDPLHFASRIAPRELIVIGARNDAAFPTASTQALYDSAREPRTLIWMDTGHVRAREKGIVQELMRLIDEQL